MITVENEMVMEEEDHCELSDWLDPYYYRGCYDSTVTMGGPKNC